MCMSSLSGLLEMNVLAGCWFVVILPLYKRQESLSIKTMSQCPLICESDACKTALRFQKKKEPNLQEQSQRKGGN